MLAFEKAKARAQALATAAGATLGAVLAVEEGEGAELLPFAADKGRIGGIVRVRDRRTGRQRPGQDRRGPEQRLRPAPPTKPGKSQVKSDGPRRSLN